MVQRKQMNSERENMNQLLSVIRKSLANSNR